MKLGETYICYAVVCRTELAVIESVVLALVMCIVFAHWRGGGDGEEEGGRKRGGRRD